MEGARQAFEQDRRNILALVGEAQKRAKYLKSSVDWHQLNADVLNYLRNNSQDNWRSTFTPLLQGVISDQGERWNTSFGMTFDVQNLFALQWFNDYQLTFSNYIMLTSENELSSLLQQGMYEGWSIPTLQRNIGSLFDQWQTGQASDDLDWWEERLPPYRLELIARTETMRASNAGSFQLFKNWQAPYKEWLATGDDRTRPSHMDAWGTYSKGGRVGAIPIDEPFQVNGRDMMHPGDPAGGVEECANCRCALLPAFDAPSVADREGIHESEWLSIWDDPQRRQEFEQHWENFLQNLPEDERKAIRDYTGSWYSDINRLLRGRDEYSTGFIQKTIANMETGLNKGGAQFNMQVFRGNIPAKAFGLESWDAVDLQALVGKGFQDNGFTSGSISRKVSENFTDRTKAFATVRVPAGTPGAYVESITQNPEEYEWLFNHGTKFRVVEVFMDTIIHGINLELRVPHFILEVVR